MLKIKTNDLENISTTSYTQKTRPYPEMNEKARN